MAKRDFYEVLGVRKGTQDGEIRKAYRRLARKFHPDVNPGDAAAETRFKEISEAYQILSDPEKRKQYDLLGMAAFDPASRARGSAGGNPSGGAGFGGFDFSGFDPGGEGPAFGDLFRDLFGHGRRRGAQAAPSGPEKGGDLSYPMEVGFLDAYRGLKATISLQKDLACSACSGHGRVSSGKVSPCPDCQGSGQREIAKGPLRFSQPCTSCNGSGKIVGTPCTSCGGRGAVPGTERLTVQIPPGVDNGSRVRVAGKGLPGKRGGPPGNLYIITRVRSHRLFQRKGDALTLELPISVAEATLGGRVEVPTVTGHARLRIPTGTPSGRVFRLTGKGMPRLKGGGHGDLLVTVRIVPPRRLTPSMRELMEQWRELETEDPRQELKE